MALLDLALEGMAVFGFVLFLVLWLMHFMAIIYTHLGYFQFVTITKNTVMNGFHL